MWPVSSRFLDTLAHSHTRVSSLDVLVDGQLEQTLTDGFLVEPNTGNVAALIGGNVAVERTAIRRSCSISFADVNGQLMPVHLDSLLAPYVTELRVYNGVRYWDSSTGESELVPVGTFVITDADSSSYPQITIQGYDRFWYCTRFSFPYTINAGTPVDEAIITLANITIPTTKLSINLPTTEATTPKLDYDIEADIADAMHDIAVIAGWALFMDPMGTLTAVPEPSTEDDFVVQYQPGTGSVMTRPRRVFGGNDPKNAVVFTSESAAGVPLRGYAQDDDPNSLTNVDRIGVRPYFESSPVMNSQALVDSAARTTLQRILGVTDLITTPVVPNAALESGDVAWLIDEDQNIDRSVIIDSFTLPLRAADGAQELQCRSDVTR